MPGVTSSSPCFMRCDEITQLPVSKPIPLNNAIVNALLRTDNKNMSRNAVQVGEDSGPFFLVIAAKNFDFTNVKNLKSLILQGFMEKLYPDGKPHHGCKPAWIIGSTRFQTSGTRTGTRNNIYRPCWRSVATDISATRVSLKIRFLVTLKAIAEPTRFPQTFAQGF